MLNLQAIFGDESEPATGANVACKADESLAIAPTNATAVWQAALDRVEDDPLFPPDVMDALRAADARWVDDPEAVEVDQATEVIDPPDPCPQCQSLELWQTVVGNWRCLRCDPPIIAQQLRLRAAQLSTYAPIADT